jgi:SAM-dependent methyltransferase
MGKIRNLIVAHAEERLALMAPARRLRLALADRAASTYAQGRPIRLLDAGCADGLLSLALARKHQDWAVTGVDMREDLLSGARARAKGRGLANAGFEVADLMLPLPGSGYDVVAALECLSEIPDDARALRTIADAVLPGGLVVIQVPEREWAPVLPGSEATWRDEVRHGYGPEEIAAKVREAGLEVFEVRMTYRALAAATQELRDRIKNAALPIRLLAFPFLATAVRLERWGLTWGRANAIFVLARRPAA